MTSTLTLAARLRSLSDSDLIVALRRRKLATTGIRDFFDAADALLSPSAIQLALAAVDRPTLAAFAGSAPVTPVAVECADRLLLGDGSADGPVVFEEVRARLAAWPGQGLPDAAALADEPKPTGTTLTNQEQATVDALAAEHAFLTGTSVAELLHQLKFEPARRLSRGGISQPDLRRIADALAVDTDVTLAFISMAVRAGLVSEGTGQLHATDAADDWLGLEASGRWIRLATAFADSLPESFRTLLAGFCDHGEHLRPLIGWLFPAGGAQLAEAVELGLRESELLGVTARHTPSTPARLLLAGGPDASIEAITALLPPSVSNVYLQHDLSIVAPGPLTPDIDARLRTLADAQTRAVASTYRVTSSSLNRALAGGESAESLTGFLESISLTGIPQPLAYLIDETARRFGALRVGSLDGTEGFSYVRSDDTELLHTVLVDQSLAVLGLRATGPYRLVSRRDPAQLFWTLSEARYPVAAEDDVGRLINLRRNRPVPVPDAPDPYIGLVHRLRAADADSPQDTGQAWLVRQLESAIRARSTLTVRVMMPNGSVTTFVLEPTSVAGGRLRARDNSSGVERTLPLASIHSVGEG